MDALAHPTAAELEAFGSGKLDNEAAAAVLQHLEVCPACRRVAGQPSADSFAGRPKAAAPPPASVGAPAELAGLPGYEVVRELGHGGMGVVYLARNRLMERYEVLKVIARSLVEKPEALERFRREIVAAGQLQHPNIVTAYTALQAGDLLILAMEYVEGADLARVLRNKGPLPLAHACHYARQAAAGLQHAHERGMTHRDIKPQNLMLTPKGQVKILDFGLARLREQPGGRGLTSENAVMGTPEYLAPEQALDARTADVRADLYSLGCTLYCLLTGRPPFQAETAMKMVLAHLEQEPEPLRRRRPDAPAALETVVMRLLAKRPTDRFQTPAELARALAPFARAQEATPAPPPPERQDGSATATGTVIPGETSHGPGRSLTLPPEVRARAAVPVVAVPVAPVPVTPSPVAPVRGDSLDEPLDLGAVSLTRRPARRPQAAGWKRWLAPALVAGSVALLGVALGVVGLVILLRTPNRTEVAVTRGETERVPIPLKSDRPVEPANRPPVAEIPPPRQDRPGRITETPPAPPPNPNPIPVRPAPPPAPVPNDPPVARPARRLPSRVISKFHPGSDDGWYTTTVDDSGPQGPDVPRTTPRRGRSAPGRVDVGTPATADGAREWVELFNGGDLARWKEDSQKQWQVEGQELIGSGPNAYLFSKDAYSNFHLRVVMKLENRGSISFFLRADGKRSGTAPRGHEVKVTTVPDTKAGEGTVSIATVGAGQSRSQRAVAFGSDVRPDKQFTIDIFVQEKQLVVVIDGEAVSFVVGGQAGLRSVDLQQDMLDVGQLALQAASAGRARILRAAVRELKRPRGARTVEVVSQKGGECYLESKSDLGFPQIWGWHAPAKFHGDQSDKFGTCLKYRVWTDHADANKNCRHVRLQGNDLTLVVDEPALPVPPAGAWKEQTIRLDRSGGWKKVVGRAAIAATDEEIKRALAAVTDLRISGSYSLEKDTGRLGTVEFGVPE